MKTCNFNKRINKEQIIVLTNYAKRLEADEMIIHKDGTISLYNNYGCICERYLPTKDELYGHKEIWIDHEEYLEKVYS